jgi:DSF synthase
MSNIEKLQRTTRFDTVRVESSPNNLSHWLYMHSDNSNGARPCFRTELMDDMWNFLSSITLRNSQHVPGQLRHVVIGSDAEAFNLGGDLKLFSRLIRDNNRIKLMEYARRCIDGVYHLQSGLGGDVRTIALVQGDALGGGLELALACHTIVAEEGAGMGLPESVFGLFPGMGAYSFLCKRVSPQVAEKMILDGTIYSSEEMHRMGVVDVLVPKGQGKAAVEELIRKQQRNPYPHLAMNSVRGLAQQHVSYDELIGITEIWVDTALALGEKSIRTMERIVRAQHRLSQSAAA